MYIYIYMDIQYIYSILLLKNGVNTIEHNNNLCSLSTSQLFQRHETIFPECVLLPQLLAKSVSNSVHIFSGQLLFVQSSLMYKIYPVKQKL